jgi:L-amino acid N-acyltransferase YncA
MLIRPAEPGDSVRIAEIYNHYIATSHATFELDPIETFEMENRVRETLDGGSPFYVSEENELILGYAYGRQFRPRPAYRHSIEVSVYVKQGHEQKRIATRLYENILPVIERGNFHAIVAGISLPNDASIRLHEKFGFEKVAHFSEIGRKFDRWIDVGYWQLILPR